MWTRAEVKSRAKAALRNYYWFAFLACFIATFLGGGEGGISNTISTQISNGEVFLQLLGEDMYLSVEALATMLLVSVVVLVLVVVVAIFGIFIGGPVQVGLKRYLLESRELQRSAGIGRLFWVFNSGHYLNVVKIMFLKGLFQGLWSLLFIIPGIVKGYEYSMIPYLLAENPGMESSEVFRLSRELTMGHKGSIFVLDWSFFGWYLLGAMCCGIGTYFVLPYVEATKAELYLILNPMPPQKSAGGFGEGDAFTEVVDDPFAGY